MKLNRSVGEEVMERYTLKQADLLMCGQKKRLVCREIFISKCIELLVDRAINKRIDTIADRHPERNGIGKDDKDPIHLKM